MDKCSRRLWISYFSKIIEKDISYSNTKVYGNVID